MKTNQEIIESILQLEESYNVLNKEYYCLSQIDMQGGEGKQLRSDISETKGKIKALKWVINDKT